ncbi:MAG: rhomboid family intramembrane serine protease [Verrucomicrobiota bacterium]|nr:rhomboid family intramembrane serine protease [Verrucomicrobiota bacterium]
MPFYSSSMVLIFLNVGFFAFQALSGSGPWFDQTFALSITGLQEGKLWQLVTYGFVNSNPVSLVLGCLMIWFFAPAVEENVGRFQFWMLLGASLFFAGIIFVGCAFFFKWDLLVAGNMMTALTCFAAFVALYPDLDFFFGINAKFILSTFFLFTLFVMALQRSMGLMLSFVAMPTAVLYIRFIAMSPYGLPVPDIFRKAKLGKPKAIRTSPVIEEPSGDFISKAVDPILDKISRQGMHSLTPEEKKILDKASRKLNLRK